MSAPAGAILLFAVCVILVGIIAILVDWSDGV